MWFANSQNNMESKKIAPLQEFTILDFAKWKIKAHKMNFSPGATDSTHFLSSPSREQRHSHIVPSSIGSHASSDLA